MKTIEIYPNTFVGIDVIFGTILFIIWMFCLIKIIICAIKDNIETMWKYVVIMWFFVVISHILSIIFKPK